MAAMQSLLGCILVLLAVLQGANASTLRLGAANITNALGNATLPVNTTLPVNGTLPANATVPVNGTLPPGTAPTPQQIAVTQRTVALGTPSNFLNATTAATFLSPNFTAFAANVSGPLSLATNASSILGYLSTNYQDAIIANVLANISTTQIKQMILIDTTVALVTAQIPALQHYATILWVYINSTNTSSIPADWYARTATFVPAPLAAFL